MTDAADDQVPRKGHAMMRETHEFLVPLMVERGFTQRSGHKKGSRDPEPRFIEADGDENLERGVIIEFKPGGLSPQGHISAVIFMPSISITYRPEAELRAELRGDAIDATDYVTSIAMLDRITPAKQDIFRLYIQSPSFIPSALGEIMRALDNEAVDWWRDRRDPLFILSEILEIARPNQTDREKGIALSYVLGDVDLAKSLLEANFSHEAKFNDPTRINNRSRSFLNGMQTIFA